MSRDADRFDASAIHDAVSSRMGRRRFLRTLGKFGVGVGMAHALEPAHFEAAAADEIPIVYAYTRRNPVDPASVEPRVKTVPGDWYAAVERAFETRRAILEDGLDGVIGAFVAPGALDRASASLTIDAAAESVRDGVFDLLDGLDLPDVDVNVDVLDGLGVSDRPAEPTPRYADDVDDRRVEGGVYCGSADNGGSLAPAMYADGDDAPFFATSNHLYGAGGAKQTSHRGEPLHLEGPEERRRIGEVHRGFPNEDVVWVRPVDGYQPTSSIDGEPRRVAGQFTRWGLADLEARDEPLIKIGAMSDRTTGQIKGVDGITCYVGDVCKTGQLKWGDEDVMTDGDSGSVSYHPDPEHPDDQVLVAGFNNARTWWPGGNYTWGTAAYHVRERYGLHF